MAGWGNFTVADCYPAIQQNLGGKVLADADMAEWIRKAILELAGDYGFQGLQQTGPFVRLTAGINAYANSFFLQVDDAELDVRRVNSFFMYYSPFIANPPVQVALGSANAGVQLKYRSIVSIENSLNITSIPNYWSRFQGQWYIAPIPQYTYLTYMRYQKEHPFPNAGTDNAGDDVIYLDDDWQDVVEYAAAYRAAISTRLLDYASQIRTILYGDPKAVDANGRRIDLGLIFSRVPQYERDVVTSTRSLQPRRV
ncbi:MAG TPA: hypothetical protein VGF75_05580 [Candidatus Saccharimonadales bacterium]|jgi:hypothetical protein